MKNSELINYIRKMLADNTPIETIKNNLIIAGWDPLVINEALNEVRITDSQIDTSDSDASVPKKRKKGGDYLMIALGLNIVGPLGGCSVMLVALTFLDTESIYVGYFIGFLVMSLYLFAIYCSFRAIILIYSYRDFNTGLKEGFFKKIFVTILSLLLIWLDVTLLYLIIENSL